MASSPLRAGNADTSLIEFPLKGLQILVGEMDEKTASGMESDRCQVGIISRDCRNVEEEPQASLRVEGVREIF